MRVALLTATFVVVLAASALNLFLGGLWVATFLAVAFFRRQSRHAAWLVFLLTLATGAGAVHFDWIAPPVPASYGVHEAAWLGARLADLVGQRRGDDTGTPPGAALRARLQERRIEELRYTAGEVERRAAAFVTASRGLGRFRHRAPAEVGAVEEAVRRLALTLTAPEFRDLDGRRRRLLGWLTDLDTRLRMARDESELELVARALEPAAMAPVSYRALYEDLGRVNTAMRALVRAVSGGDVGVTAASRLEYVERHGQVVREDRYRFSADPPLRIRQVDLEVLRRDAGLQGAAQTLSYSVARGESRELASSGEIELATAAPEVLVTDRRVRAAALVPLRAALRPVAFSRLGLEWASSPPEFAVTIALDTGSEAVALVALDARPTRLERVTLPLYAFHYASVPGVVVSGDQDVWVPMQAGGLPGLAPNLGIEVMPALLRHPLFVAIRAYLYAPNPVTVLVSAGLAALTHILIQRPHGVRSRAGPAAGI